MRDFRLGLSKHPSVVNSSGRHSKIRRRDTESALHMIQDHPAQHLAYWVQRAQTRDHSEMRSRTPQASEKIVAPLHGSE
jgi:hypothetical protein